MSKKVIIIAVVVIAAAGLIFVPSMLVGSETGDASRRNVAMGESVFSVRTEQAGEQTLQAYIEINGDIVTEQQVAVVPDAGGKIVSMKVDLGSTVRKGQLIAEVDPSRPGTTYSLSPVYAPISGTVTATPMAIGSTVTTASAITTISVMDSLEIEVLVPEREVGQLKEGLKAEVTLQAYPGEIFSATVIRVSPVVDPNSRTKKIVLKFDDKDSRINSGMFARVKLNTRSYDNVITVPTEALVELRGSTYVYVMEGIDHVSLREVVAGVSVDDLSEIKSGLTGGETVVIQGQQFLTDGASVRVINTRNQQA
ncbi:efflux RND transporter periplasmic adaptor subunit [Breznakiella homolactica]|uniref:Efflux RND transporter periplasmic adaptor subunit n=1 Tax=Breznakiella homolactica TaxID=2798577 RepID=A0A7T7XJB2_9SPIR|nr:efflux RND transporter periplasmic adaptor subunit [Breznakiella homolactica]QQO07455.1 efflux RND transporter periplasmic adaptor subunit [Breznakiella homolactica]